MFGCKTTPDVTAFKVLKSTAVSVDSAKSAWVDYVTAQRKIMPVGTKVRAELEANVAKGSVIYGQYQIAMEGAINALDTYRKAPVDMSPVNKAISVLSASASDFIALVRAIMYPVETK